MKRISLLTVLMTLGLTLAPTDADARRCGGGRSFGMQRQMTPPARPPASTPAPSQSSAAGAAKSPAAAAQPGRSWMGPLAGLAAGLGLAALASHFGFGQELASMLMIGLLVLAVMFVIGQLSRRRAAAQQPAMAGGEFQYAGSDPARTAAAPRPYDVASPVSAAGAAAATPGHIPADFDVPGFVRNAKVHFIRLQAANDARNLADIREFTTPEMFAEIKMDLAERGDAAQETDVVNIHADVLDVAEEDARYIVSVRFTGQIREGAGAPAEPVDEIWHLIKPRDGNSGWLLAGIQQTQ